MPQLFVGWVRWGWRHWEQVIAPCMDVDAHDALHQYKIPKNEPDGAKVVMPAGEHPLRNQRTQQ